MQERADGLASLDDARVREAHFYGAASFQQVGRDGAEHVGLGGVDAAHLDFAHGRGGIVDVEIYLRGVVVGGDAIGCGEASGTR